MIDYPLALIIPVDHFADIDAYVTKQMSLFADKWDWYVFAWSDKDLTNEPVDADGADGQLATTERAATRDAVPTAVLTPDGHWHERGWLGDWAMLADENARWDGAVRDLFRRHPGHRVARIEAILERGGPSLTTRGGSGAGRP
jgi:hypothetical protein